MPLMPASTWEEKVGRWIYESEASWGYTVRHYTLKRNKNVKKERRWRNQLSWPSTTTQTLSTVRRRIGCGKKAELSPPSPSLSSSQRETECRKQLLSADKRHWDFCFFVVLSFEKILLCCHAGLKLKGFFHLGLQRSWVLSELKAFTTILAQDYFWTL